MPWGGGVHGSGLYNRIISVENLHVAWREFRRGKRKSLEVQQFEFTLEERLFQLHELLESRAYVIDPYVDFYVRDPKLRHIHKASVRDRVLFQAVFRVLYPIFDRSFFFDSYASRTEKGIYAALDRLDVFTRKASENYQRPVWGLKCDIRKFFDSVDHEILICLIIRKVKDADCLRLIAKIIGSFEKTPGKGLPLGNVTSQLFANIYLHELDFYIKERLRVKYYLRYCDDFLIIDRSPKDFADILRDIQSFLASALKLELHPRKVSTRRAVQGIDFLGWVHFPYHRLLRTATKRRVMCSISISPDFPALQSYMGLLSHGNTRDLRWEVLKRFISLHNGLQ